MPEQQIQVKIPPEMAKGARADGLALNSEHGTVILDFLTALPGMTAPEVVCRVVIAPEHLAPFIDCLQRHKAYYEERFGPIPVRPQPEQQVVFSVGGAKA